MTDPKSKEVLKGYFKTNKIPTQQHFEDLIDGMITQEEVKQGQNPTATGIVIPTEDRVKEIVSEMLQVVGIATLNNKGVQRILHHETALSGGWFYSGIDWRGTINIVINSGYDHELSWVGPSFDNPPTELHDTIWKYTRAKTDKIVCEEYIERRQRGDHYLEHKSTTAYVYVTIDNADGIAFKVHPTGQIDLAVIYDDQVQSYPARKKSEGETMNEWYGYITEGEIEQQAPTTKWEAYNWPSSAPYPVLWLFKLPAKNFVKLPQ
jgi:hypothetical protein